MKERLIVIGNGMAGTRAIEELSARAPGHYDITVFGAEPFPNYDRLQLSAVLTGEKVLDDIVIHPRTWYELRDIRLIVGDPITTIDRAAGTVTSASGKVAAFDKLLVATGSRPLVPPIRGLKLSGVSTYREIADVEKMLAGVECHTDAVVMGGGLLGLEAACGLQRCGMAVTVVHLMPTLMERQLDAGASTLLQRELIRSGITVLTGSETEKIFGCERATGVRLTNGFSIAADLVVIAIGIRPNAELARAAGLRVRRGIVVGDDMRTSDPAIFAVGECVEHRGEVFGMVSALWDQARVCAAQLAGDARAAYRPPTPFTRLKIGGIEMFSAGALSAGDPSEAEIMFQDTERGVYRKVVLRDDKLIGAVLYGDVRDGPWYVDLMRQGIDIGEIRDDLVFGRVYDGRTVPTGVLVDRAPELAA